MTTTPPRRGREPRERGGTVIPIDAPRRARADRASARGAAAVAAGAARAGGERDRRRRSSLLDPQGRGAAPARPDTAAKPRAQGAEAGRAAGRAAGPAVRPKAGPRRSPVVPADLVAADLVAADLVPADLVPADGDPAAAGAHASGGKPALVARYAVESVVEALVAEARRAGVTDADQRVARLLAWVRRRISGDYAVDEFGFDVELTDALLPLLRPLYRKWFRVEVRGIENVPADGGALIVANHSGTIALDSVMTQLAILDEHPAHRHLRLLGADLVFALPVVGELARKTGSTLASSSDAERLLRQGELVGVWPEGFKGSGKPFSERYKLQRFGRGGFVSAAVQAQVPIVPCSIVGAEEIYPILGNLTTLARLLGLPYLPVTPTFPLLGPLGLIPLPSKWIIEFGAPIDTQGMLDEQGDGADDPMLVFDLTDRVRETIQQTLYALLLQRRSVFF